MQPCGLKIGAHHLRSGGEGGFHPRLAVQAQGACFAGDKARADHHVWVRCVGAGCDRGDDNLTARHCVILACDGNFFVQRTLEGVLHLALKGRFGVVEGHVILRPLGARDGGNDGAHVQLECGRVDRVVVRAAPEAVLLGVGFHKGDAVFVAARGAHIAQGFGVNWEEATRCAVFWGHVADGGAVRQRQIVEALTVEFYELADNAVGAEHLNNLEHEVGGRRAFDHFAGQLKAHNLGDQHRDRLAQHRGLCFDPANTPAEDGGTIDHGGVRVCANKRVRIGDFFAILIGIGPDDLCQILKVYLVTDAGAGGHYAEVLKRVLAPFQKLIALHVPLILAVHIHLEGARIAKLVDHH